MHSPAFNAQEIEQIRRATSGTEQKIHFNNAGCSLPPNAVVESVIDYLKEEARVGGYETEAKYQSSLDAVYPAIAKLINAHPEEIAFVENASTAWWNAFNGIEFSKGDEVITSEFEYTTNLIGLLKIKKTKGVGIKVIPTNEDGDFSLSAMEAAISPATKLIAITHIPSTAGGVLPIVAIGRLAKQHKILYLVDGCQSVGHFPIDVREIGCDLLSVTGRKYMRAPRGTGFLYVRKEIQDLLPPAFLDGRSIQSMTTDDYTVRPDARRYELYESSRALKIGFGKAVETILDLGISRIWQQIQYVAELLREVLAELDGITVHDKGTEKCGIVTFSVEGVDAAAVRDHLAKHSINVSVGMAVSTLLYMDRNHLPSVVRASVHYYNTVEEIQQMADALILIKG